MSFLESAVVYFVTIAILGPIALYLFLKMVRRDILRMWDMAEGKILLPCPFCGCDTPTRINYNSECVISGMEVGDRYRGCYAVQCSMCSAQTGWNYTEVGAAQNWNKRPK